jgi:hypothetical protein
MHHFALAVCCLQHTEGSPVLLCLVFYKCMYSADVQLSVLLALLLNMGLFDRAQHQFRLCLFYWAFSRTPGRLHLHFTPLGSSGGAERLLPMASLILGRARNEWM